MKMAQEAAAMLADGIGMLLMGAALLLAAPVMLLVAALCAAGVFRSHGGIGPVEGSGFRGQGSGEAKEENMGTAGKEEWQWTGGSWSPKMLYGDTAGVFEALGRRLEKERRKARRRRVWRVRGRLMRRAWREVRRSRLAAVTAGVWIAVALVKAWEVACN